MVFFGDSLTLRTGVIESPIPARRFSMDYAGTYVDILVKKLLVHYPMALKEYYNMGIGGNKVVDLLGRVDEVIALNPDRVVLFIGQNDANLFSVTEYKNNLKKLLDLFRINGIKVIQLSTTLNPNRNKSKVLDEYDLVIKELCKEYSNYFVDVKSSFKRVSEYNEKNDTPICLFNDDCHMSELGNLLIADIVFDAIIEIEGLKG